VRGEHYNMIDYDKIALEYVQHRQVHPEVLKSLFLTSGIGTISKVLEVGCGTGNYIVALESLTGCSCWGIDPSEQMLSKARKRSERISFQLGKAEKLDFPQNFFDFVFSADVIHHVSNIMNYFQEAYRVLKRGRKLCTVTDSEWIIRNRQPLAVYFPETVEADLRRYPSIPKLKDYMKQVGFDTITEIIVEFTYQLTDAQPYRDKAFSSLHIIPEKAFQRGIKHMKQDLNIEPIKCVSRYMLLWGTK